MGGSSSTFGSLKLDFEVGDFPMSETFHIVDDGPLGGFEIFLGSSFLIDNGTLADYRAMELVHDYFTVPIYIEKIMSQWLTSRGKRESRIV